MQTNISSLYSYCVNMFMYKKGAGIFILYYIRFEHFVFYILFLILKRFRLSLTSKVAILLVNPRPSTPVKTTPISFWIVSTVTKYEINATGLLWRLLLPVYLPGYLVSVLLLVGNIGMDLESNILKIKTAHVLFPICIFLKSAETM